MKPWPESPQEQGSRERIVYTVDTTLAGGSPTGVAVSVLDESLDFEDVTTAVMPTNSPTVAANVISCSVMINTVDGHRYRLRVLYVEGTNNNTVDEFGHIDGVR